MNRKARRRGTGIGKGPDPQAVEQLVGLCRAQRFAQAMPLAREFTRRWPKHAVGWHALAACAQAAGDTGEAIRAYRRALSIEPDNPDAHNNLGLLLAGADRAGEAEKSYRHALRLRPGFMEARFNLATLLSAQGRHEEAAECHRAVLESRPDLVEAHNALANALQALGRADEAEASLRRALELQPDHAGVLGNLALLLQRRRRPEEAEDMARRAVRAQPDSAVAQHNLGIVLAGRGRLPAAIEAFRAALAIDPDLAPAHHELGNALMDRGELDAGEAAHRRAAELRLGDAGAQRDLGVALASMGRTEEAADAWRRALALRPGHAEVHYQLAHAHRFEPGDADLRALEAALAESAERTAGERAFLHFAAGKAYADTGDVEGSFEHYARANRLRRAEIDYDVAADEARMERIAALFDTQRLAALREAGDPTDAPVFIVGMWRSGTSLVEQILASHPAVHGAGERNDLRLLVEAIDAARGFEYPEWVAQLSGEDIASLAVAYRETVVDTIPGVRRVTEKTPEHFLYLGLVAAMFPHARIVHVRRDPVDTCLSCYTRSFGDRVKFSYDLAELGRYYRAYAGLMEHWRRTLPAELLLEVAYEDVVAQPEREARRLIAHLGLEWDPACLDFHRTQRAVSTASLVQVRQPLYRHAVRRWEPYRAHLGPLLEALGPLAPEDA